MNKFALRSLLAVCGLTVPLVSATICSAMEKLLVIPVNVGASHPLLYCNRANIDSIVFSDAGGNSVKQFYQDVTWGNMTFTADSHVVDPITINANWGSGSCQRGQWATLADAAYQSLYGDLNQYTRIGYIIPRCNGANFGEGSRLWVQDFCDSPDSFIYTFAHEFGHTLGLLHAGGSVPGPAPGYEDLSDVMGSGFMVFFNAPHTVFKGWLPPENVQQLTGPGTFEIAALEEDPMVAVNPQVLWLDMISFSYYVSLRHTQSWHNTLPSTYANKVNVHSSVIDGGTGRDSYFERGVGPGDPAFVDTSTNVNVSFVSYGALGDTVIAQIGLPANTVAPEGEVTFFGTRRILGWAYDGNAGDPPCPVDLYGRLSNGEYTFVTRTLANNSGPRANVPPSHPAYGKRHGFEFLLDGVPYTRFRIYADDVSSATGPVVGKVLLGQN